MNFSGLSSTKALGKILRLPLRWIPPHAVVPILQGKLRGKKWVAGSSTHGCWLGSYELVKQRIFAANISRGDVVFDVGANVGFYTLLAAELVGASGKVVAFEPVPSNLAYLRRHLHLNGISNVQIVAAAVSDADGTTWFQKGRSSAMGRIASSGDWNVRMISLDSLVTLGQVPVPAIIKMDVEGAEFQALQGAQSILTEHHPVIFLASHGPDVHRSCCDYLRSLGYTLESVNGAPIEDTDEVIARYHSAMATTTAGGN